MSMKNIENDDIDKLIRHYDKMSKSRVGVSKTSPAHPTKYHLLYTADSKNKYAEGYTPLCSHAREEHLVILHAPKANLSDKKICEHCKNIKQKFINIEKKLRKCV